MTNEGRSKPDLKVLQQNGIPGDLLNGKKLRALSALIENDSIDKAVNASGISRVSFYRYMQDPVFDRELRAAQRKFVDEAIFRLQQACSTAAETLIEVCKNSEATSASRVSAAREILTQTLKALEAQEIEVRLSALEDLMKGK